MPDRHGWGVLLVMGSLSDTDAQGEILTYKEVLPIVFLHIYIFTGFIIAIHKLLKTMRSLNLNLVSFRTLVLYGLLLVFTWPISMWFEL